VSLPHDDLQVPLLSLQFERVGLFIEQTTVVPPFLPIHFQTYLEALSEVSFKSPLSHLFNDVEQLPSIFRRTGVGLDNGEEAGFSLQQKLPKHSDEPGV
jgi:hypothetical protein